MNLDGGLVEELAIAFADAAIRELETQILAGRTDGPVPGRQSQQSKEAGTMSAYSTERREVEPLNPNHRLRNSR